MKEKIVKMEGSIGNFISLRRSRKSMKKKREGDDLAI